MNELDERSKLAQSVAELEHALSFSKEAQKDRFYLSGITKCFETCIEYAWKYMRKKALDAGLDPASPVEAIKCAGKIGMIDDVERWIDFLKNRNLTVHDYVGVSSDQCLALARTLLGETKKIVAVP